jgi:general secretion pathway protein A
VLNPKQTPLELLETVCEELHIVAPGKRRSLKTQIDLLNEYLLQAYAQDLRVVLIIDEAQELSRELLEQVRLLTNLETSTQKLLQIVLLGQPELRYQPTPLQPSESSAYLRHRITVAGGSVFPFEDAAVRRLHALSGGVPRLLNVLGERALLAGYVHGRGRVDVGLVNLAAAEVMPTQSADSSAWRILGWCLVLGGAALLWLALSTQGVI